MRRNPAIEFYRILMMFGIVLLHVCQQRAGSWPNNVLVSCVPGFVLISGYFGIKFSWRKLLSLYLVAIYASVLVPLVGGVTSWPDYGYEVLRVWNIRLDAVQPSGFWFLHAYAVMSVLTIPVEMMLEGELTASKALRLRQLSLPIFVVVFGWGFLTKFKMLVPIVPTVNGLQAFSPLTLFASYLVGRNLSVWERLRGRIPCRIILSVLIASFVLLSVSRAYLCGYNSLLSVLLAGALFCLIRDFTLPDVISKWILKLAPSMFAVYTIHTHMYFPGMDHAYMVFGRECLQKASSVSMGWGVLLSAVFVFIVALVLDVPRRLGGWVLRRWFYKSPKRVLSIT